MYVLMSYTWSRHARSRSQHRAPLEKLIVRGSYTLVRKNNSVYKNDCLHLEDFQLFSREITEITIKIGELVTLEKKMGFIEFPNENVYDYTACVSCFTINIVYGFHSMPITIRDCRCRN
jgi:hypothetical protein